MYSTEHNLHQRGMNLLGSQMFGSSRWPRAAWHKVINWIVVSLPSATPQHCAPTSSAIRTLQGPPLHKEGCTSIHLRDLSCMTCFAWWNVSGGVVSSGFQMHLLHQTWPPEPCHLPRKGMLPIATDTQVKEPHGRPTATFKVPQINKQK